MKRKLTGFLGRAFSYPEYAEAYKSAGDLLVGYMAMPGTQEPLALPALYLYRHYIELMLKVILYMDIDLDETDKRSNKPKLVHDIGKLWKQFELRIQARLPDYDAEISVIRPCIAELSKIDGSGEKLRYPEDTLGHEVLFGTEDVDLIALREAVSKAAESLNSLHGALSDIWHERWNAYDEEPGP
ncbi:MAG: hypothetical protein ACYC92_03140 [Candidatus Acidiferrales bacterium]